MPEGRDFPYKFIPRLNQEVSVKISTPIRNPEIENLRREFRSLVAAAQTRFQSKNRDQLPLNDSSEAKEIRIRVAELLRQQLKTSGESKK